MRWQTAREKRYQKHQALQALGWQPWYAWYPKTISTTRVWLEWIERRHDGLRSWPWQYRLPPETRTQKAVKELSK